MFPKDPPVVGSLTSLAVDSLAQEIQVPEVPRGLLDQMSYGVPEVETHPGGHGLGVQGVRGDDGAGSGALRLVVGDEGCEGVGGGEWEVAVWLVLGPGPLGVFGGEVDAEPEAFDAGQVLHEARWTEFGGADRPAEGLLVGEAGDLVHHGVPQKIEHADQGRPLVGALGWAYAFSHGFKLRRSQGREKADRVGVEALIPGAGRASMGL